MTEKVILKVFKDSLIISNIEWVIINEESQSIVIIDKIKKSIFFYFSNYFKEFLSILILVIKSKNSLFYFFKSINNKLLLEINQLEDKQKSLFLSTNKNLIISYVF